MKSFFKELWRDESGQGATEYILILVVVVTIVTVFKDNIRGIIKERTKAISGKMEGVFK